MSRAKDDWHVFKCDGIGCRKTHTVMSQHETPPDWERLCTSKKKHNGDTVYTVWDFCPSCYKGALKIYRCKVEPNQSEGEGEHV